MRWGVVVEMKRFREVLRGPAPPLTFEAVSPKGWVLDGYVDDLRRMGLPSKVDAVNIPNNPTARVKVDPVPYGLTVIRELGVDAVVHVTCRDDTLAGMQRWLLGAHAAGVRNLLVMTGDHPTTGDYPAERRVDSVNTLELITGVKKFLNRGYLMPDIVLRPVRNKNRYDPDMDRIDAPTEFTAGAVLLPSRAGEAEYAAQKMRAGADFFQTQITFDPAEVVSFLEKCAGAGINMEVPVLVSVAPIRSASLLRFMRHKIPNLVIPDEVYTRLRDARDIVAESVRAAVDTAGAVLDGVRDRGLPVKVGIHVVPIDDTDAGARIVDLVRAEVIR